MVGLGWRGLGVGLEVALGLGLGRRFGVIIACLLA